jgi:WD40 repeat protein
VWDIVIQHNEHQKERFEIKLTVERATAKTINDNQSRLVVKGVLTVDLADRIGLAKILVRDPVTSFEISKDFNPIIKLDGRVGAFSPNGQLLALIKDSKVGIYNIDTRQQIAEFGHSKNVISVAFSPDCKFLATGGYDEIARIFNIDTRQQIAEFGHSGEVYSVDFSPDGNFLATGSYYKACIFNLETRQKIVEFGHSYYALSVTYSPDGKFLATVKSTLYSSNIAQIFNLETRQQIAEFAHRDLVLSVAFSPDGKFLATGCDDGKARIFDLEKKKEINSYDYGSQVALSPVGNYLAMSGSGKTQIMNISTGTRHCLYDVEETLADVEETPYVVEDTPFIVLETPSVVVQGPYVVEDTIAFSPDGRFLAIGDAIYRTFITMEGADRNKVSLYALNG